MNIAKHTRALVVAAMIACGVLSGGIVLAACGDDDNGPDTSPGASAQTGAGNGVDRAFVKDMVPHHESAVDMAKIARQRGQSAFVKGLASDIIRTQSAELTTLKGIASKLDAAGVKPGNLGVPAASMGMSGDTASLRTASPFDRAFIDMMVPHHQGAIRMARAELAKGQSGESKRLATQIIAAQSREIKAMNTHRKEAFGAPSPAGGVPAEDSSSDSGDSGMGMDHGG